MYALLDNKIAHRFWELVKYKTPINFIMAKVGLIAGLGYTK
jgi:hypothetical protein